MKQECFEQLDNMAWDIVCNWYKKVGFNPIYEDVDFSLLIRPVLRAKIGRAIRLKNNIVDVTVCNNAIQTAKRKQNKNILVVFKSFITLLKLKINSKKNICYIPQYARPIHSICAELLTDNELLCISRDANIANRFVYPVKIKLEIEFECFIHSLYEAICCSLQKYDLKLENKEQEELKLQVWDLGQMFIKAEKELTIIKPDMILLYSDESLPQMCYVLLAKKLGIKTVSLQHGLDCEILYLDEPYADLLLLWGEWRKKRYENSNNIFESQFEVVGNPEYDKVKLVDNNEFKNGYWLWVTRPHSADKCYSPSRLETEGADLLIAILEALRKYPEERMVIKPHPYDSIDVYRSLIEESGIKDRIQISMEPPMDLYEVAKFVITEDSTAGLEALLCGKKMIHLNFSMQPTSVPFAEHNVALLARNQPELNIQLDKILNNGYNLEPKDLELSLADFLYALDGESTKRAINCIKYFLKGN
jgi:hypothetical protein